MPATDGSGHFGGNGISSCGEACAPPGTRLGLFNKIRRRRVPAWPKHDARFYENRLACVTVDAISGWLFSSLRQQPQECPAVLAKQPYFYLPVLLCFSGPHLHLRGLILAMCFVSTLGLRQRFSFYSCKSCEWWWGRKGSLTLVWQHVVCHVGFVWKHKAATGDSSRLSETASMVSWQQCVCFRPAKK